MIHSSKQLKDLIRNLSKEVGIEAHILIRKYMMERFLERVSSSKYNGSFILKGGMLVAAFVGVEARATMDIDTTIKGIPRKMPYQANLPYIPCNRHDIFLQYELAPS